MDNSKEKYNVSDLYIAKIAPIKFDSWGGISLVKTKSKKIVVREACKEYIDLRLKKSYKYFYNPDNNLIYNMDRRYVYKLIPLTEKINKVEITLEEIINFYNKINHIRVKKDKKININDNLSDTNQTTKETQDIVLNKIIEIKNSINGIDDNLYNSIINDLIKIGESYVNGLINAENKQLSLSNNKVDIQLMCLQELSNIELKVYRLKKEQIQPSELFKDLDLFKNKLKKK